MTSSRAHTVVTIHFDQIIKDDLGETKKTSVINLVDLAGKNLSFENLIFNLNLILRIRKNCEYWSDR
jgi:hypothetical protein